MRTIKITRQELEQIRNLQVNPRHEPFEFSINESKDLWARARFGYTGPKGQKLVRGSCPKLDEIADEYLRVKSDAGAFFIDQGGVFYKSSQLKGPTQRFIVFEIYE
jgi:hypothetical protein